jgi:hypothetical protein
MHAVRREINPLLRQQSPDPHLFGREQLIPQWRGEARKSVALNGRIVYIWRKFE